MLIKNNDAVEDGCVGKIGFWMERCELFMGLDAVGEFSWP